MSTYVRCHVLRINPAQLRRLDEMTANTEARLDEARQNLWLGEVAALKEGLIHLRKAGPRLTLDGQRRSHLGEVAPGIARTARRCEPHGQAGRAAHRPP
jgi:hypothetical protein